MSINQLPMLDFEPVARHPAQGVVSNKSRPPPWCAEHTRVKQSDIDHPVAILASVAVNLNALVALRRSSWPFVDNSFFFCFK